LVQKYLFFFLSKPLPFFLIFFGSINTNQKEEKSLNLTETKFTKIPPAKRETKGGVHKNNFLKTSGYNS
jgi:hypothetical protein